jgi:hypothetical protein
VSASAVKVLRALLQSSWQEVSRIRIDDELERELGSRLRDYLRAVLERELRSAEFLDQVSRPRMRLAPGLVSPGPAPAQAPDYH